jgi:DNA-binding XRE family transcriptional regulator
MIHCGMTPHEYSLERKKRGTQERVAKLLGVTRVTIHRRETVGPVSKEAELALLALPIYHMPGPIAEAE